MTIETRINVLRESGYLSEKNYNYILEMIVALEKALDISFTEENAAPMVTHLCAALKRIEENETVLTLDDSVYESLKSEPVFYKADSISKDFQKKYDFIPEEEIKYITMHVGILLT